MFHAALIEFVRSEKLFQKKIISLRLTGLASRVEAMAATADEPPQR